MSNVKGGFLFFILNPPRLKQKGFNIFSLIEY